MLASGPPTGADTRRLEDGSEGTIHNVDEDTTGVLVDGTEGAMHCVDTEATLRHSCEEGNLEPGRSDAGGFVEELLLPLGRVLVVGALPGGTADLPEVDVFNLH